MVKTSPLNWLHRLLRGLVTGFTGTTFLPYFQLSFWFSEPGSRERARERVVLILVEQFIKETAF